MDCSPSSSSVHGISQVRILEWIAIPFFWAEQPKSEQTEALQVMGPTSEPEEKETEQRNYTPNDF